MLSFHFDAKPSFQEGAVLPFLTARSYSTYMTTLPNLLLQQVLRTLNFSRNPKYKSSKELGKEIWEVTEQNVLDLSKMRFTVAQHFTRDEQSEADPLHRFLCLPTQLLGTFVFGVTLKVQCIRQLQVMWPSCNTELSKVVNQFEHNQAFSIKSGVCS